MAGLLLQYGATFPNAPSRYDAAMRMIESERQAARVGRMRQGDSSMAVLDLAGPDDAPVLLQNSEAYQGAVAAPPAVDEQYEEMAKSSAHLIAALAHASPQESQALIERMTPRQIHSVANLQMMGGRLLPQYAGEVQATRDAASKGTRALREVMQRGGSFEDFRKDVHAGVAGFFKAFTKPEVFVPMLLAGGAAAITGGAALPVLGATIAAAAPGTGASVAREVAASQEERAAKIEARKPKPAVEKVGRQFGVRI